MNGTYREIERRILAYRERTGRDYAKVWISQDRWMMLPQAFRDAVIGNAFHRRLDAAGAIDGVPIGVIAILEPEEAVTGHAARERAWRASKGFPWPV